MTANEPAGRASLFPSGVEPLQLYWSREVLAAAVTQCASHGWQIIELDVSSWSDDAAAHAALAEQLHFPAYYGRNLDALDDAMTGVAEGRYGFASDAPGGLLVVAGIDRLLSVEPRFAAVFVEVLASTTARALRHGWPLACFLQSDDPDLRLDVDTPQTVPWNRSERARANRGQ